MAEIMATEAPVLPDVAATTVPPGLSLPSCSARVRMWSAMRSLMEPEGLANSHLPRILTCRGRMQAIQLQNVLMRLAGATTGGSELPSCQQVKVHWCHQELS